MRIPRLCSIPLILFCALSITSCDSLEGDDGKTGPAGATGATGAAGDAGAAGAAGAAGPAGVSCWDLDADGVDDPAEDVNGDTNFDVLDCREPEDTEVSGMVTSSAGGDLDDYVMLTFTPQAGGDAVDVNVEDDGYYDLDLVDGTYDILATRPGYEDYDLAGVVVAANVNNQIDIEMVAMAEGEYIGSEQCGVCHTARYESFIQSGHPYKLNKVINDTQPSYPFTTLDGVLARVTDEDGITDNALGTPTSYADISYVIGGYFWKARFVDADGYIVTGSEVQYNFATDGMVGYHDDEVGKKYNCGNCHTTGWQRTDAILNPATQDDLPGMDGTFFSGGIQCEACHGAGSKHAQTMDEMDITEDAAPRTVAQMQAADAGVGRAIACGECHTRDGERDYPNYESAFDLARDAALMPRVEMGGRIAASGGYIKHHEQGDEILGINPDDLLTARSDGFSLRHGDCTTCHDVHGSTVHQADPSYTGVMGVDKTNDNCMRCHSNKDPALETTFMVDLLCTDCHMPGIAKSATATTTAVGEGRNEGDVASHIFAIDLDGINDDDMQFTADGKFAYPAVTAEWACKTCHDGINHIDIDAFLPGYDFHSQ